VRKIFILLAAGMMTGCAAQQPTMPAVTIASNTDVASAALVFDAPITLDQEPVELPRDIRGQGAFAGYQSTSVSYYDVFSFNLESSGHDRYYRNSISEEVGTRQR
jgi:hypothetical protein